MDLRKLQHVQSELAMYAGTKKAGPNDSTFVLCPFHGERTPSFRIYHGANSRSPGYGRCYGCPAHGPWDEIAPKLGLKAYTYAKPSQQFAHKVVKEINNEPEDGTPSSEFEFKPLPKDKLWRTISTNLLRDIGCKRMKQWNESFIFVPVMVKGSERGYIRARLRKKKDAPSYLNKAGRWSELSGLFPYDFAVKMMRDKGLNCLTLVEGPRDALRLLSLGIPAVAILGTQSWSKRKAHLIELSGAEHVMLCFDGDDAGAGAEEKVTPSLEALVQVHTFNLRGKDSPYWKFRNEDEPSKKAKKAKVALWDPGEMPLRKCKQLRRRIKKLRDLAH